MWVIAGIVAVCSLVSRPHALTSGLLLAVFAASAAQTVVIPSLVAFGQVLGVSASTATWVLTAFMVAAAVATPVAGRIGDAAGHRRVLDAGLVALTVGSVVAAVGTVLTVTALVLAGSPSPR